MIIIIISKRRHITEVNGVIFVSEWELISCGPGCVFFFSLFHQHTSFDEILNKEEKAWLPVSQKFMTLVRILTKCPIWPEKGHKLIPKREILKKIMEMV